MLNKIGNRFLVGYSVPLAFLIIQGLVIISTVNQVTNLDNQVLKLQATNTQLEQLSYDISKMLRIVLGYAVLPKDQTFKRSFDSAYESFNKNAQQLREAVAIPEDEQLTNSLLTQANNFIAEGNQLHSNYLEIFRLIDANNLAQVTPQLSNNEAQNIDVKRRQFNDSVEAAINRRKQQLDQARSYMFTIIWLSTILAVLTTIIIGLRISLPLKRQLPQVVASAEQIADGNLIGTIEVTQDQTELGQILKAFHNMTKSLNTLISQAQKSGIQITSSATHIAASGKQLEATLVEQTASTNQVSATSGEIAATSGQLVKTMDNITNKAQETALAANNSQSDLMVMATAMRHLAAATTTIASTLGVMNEKANNINTVVTTITKVADQTNLLSLNAAIEAEKAGEYGAGFAVVAREIRRLADQTAVATLEIEQMVKEMQSSVSAGVMQMDKFNQEVSRAVEQVNQISGQIALVIEQVQSLTPRFEEVSHIMEQQFEGAQQISGAIAQLSQGSQQNLESLKETNRAVEQLDDAAQGLRSIISQFKVHS
ncbi:methyl-accepting chemotaxis protein [Aetokthonos hydrillicola Thurmond2011]|uniref:Methyl-accepting chemotaxis protein n=1 Tax=Aetokthonos hydrillicola Thurmond2011 TaxID=2712845 RepID=A0AAP5M8B7_9CYAN|nr:methyl-accepting chemotaxis protein [Aetokthonos hydrillicola]MBO3458705.1 methyl-accepting chemotaxis protein [Aetokthonos hydrillicola CCALA 1050]MBW4585455.1 methyl-accepting chemotaxis protein [Aetokthonos hydrillicola CCALA 1050]MDR9896075.1 methyl-accepting chemotaxis protein [Aetokthonos hydrillicola Thurmond2011]